jgi:hypothetical protein
MGSGLTEGELRRLNVFVRSVLLFKYGEDICELSACMTLLTNIPSVLGFSFIGDLADQVVNLQKKVWLDMIQPELASKIIDDSCVIAVLQKHSLEIREVYTKVARKIDEY